MAPKDLVNIDSNYFDSHCLSMEMIKKKQCDDEHYDSTMFPRVSSVDSLEQTDLVSSMSDSLRCLTSYHHWIPSDEKIRVNKFLNDRHPSKQVESLVIYHDDVDEDALHSKTFSTSDIISMKASKIFTEEDFDHDSDSLAPMDISYSHYDVQLQVNYGQLEQVVRSGIFSSSFFSPLQSTNKIHRFKINQSTQTYPMEYDGLDGHSKTNGYSSSKNNHTTDRTSSSSSSRRDRINDSNGSNPNRNNNNSRRSNDDDDDDDDDDDEGDDDHHNDNDEEEDDDDESDESLSRRLGFTPVDTETIVLVGRLRHLTRKEFFDQRDFETLQLLIDELIHHQQLERFTPEQLQGMIHSLKLDRPLRSKARALIFLQERIPRRAVKYQVISSNSPPNVSSVSVFDLWRQRERRSRLDSKDSLEEDGQNQTGQQLRDVSEINHPTPPVMFTSITSSVSTPVSKVKQMAKDIDKRSTSTMRTEVNLRIGDHSNCTIRSSSPTYPGQVSVALYDIKPVVETQSQPSPSLPISPTPSEPNLVQKMINRLESSASPQAKTITRTTTKKPFYEENSISSSPPTKRLARIDNHVTQKIDHFNSQPKISTTHEFNAQNKSNEFFRRTQRTHSGTTIDEYVTSLQPDSQTSISMVRDIRARVYDDHHDKNVLPVKIDLETLYILEQKADKMHATKSNTINERQDFGAQTVPSSISVNVTPIGIQADLPVPQQTVAAQTTASLHRPTVKERSRLPSSSSSIGDEEKDTIIRTKVTTNKYEVKRRYSTHPSSNDEAEDEGTAVIFIDNQSDKSDFEENFALKRDKHHSSSNSGKSDNNINDDDDDEPLPPPPSLEQQSPFGRITSRIRIDQLRDINRHVVRRHVQEQCNDRDDNDDEHRSNEVYEIHTRGACKCLVISSEEATQFGRETRFEKQLQRIERTYPEEELKTVELHVIVPSNNRHYQIVRRDFGSKKHPIEQDKSKQPIIPIFYYDKDGQKIRTESARRLDHLPLFIRCEIEYELTHYGSARLIILAVTDAERRHLGNSLKSHLVEDIVAQSKGRLSANSPELESEVRRQLSEPTNLLHLVDYSSRDDYQQTNSSDLRRVSRIDVTTSLRLVQRYRTVIHRLCQQHRSHLRLTSQAEQQRHMILVARDEYYLLDLSAPFLPTISKDISHIRQRQHDIFKREVNNVLQQPFDYAKYRRESEEQQKRLLKQHFQQREEQRKTPTNPPPSGHPTEAEFYLGTHRRALIEREIHSLRESIRPHDHAPPRYKHEPKRRALSASYTGPQRYLRARIIHVKDFYDTAEERDKRKAKEQELFVRVDDYINQNVANSLRRSYSTDYLREDGPRSRIRYIRIPGETVRIEEKATKQSQTVMYANLPYSLKYWNILYILDREARQGRPLGSTLPQVIVNDPYQTVIPPLTQQEIRQTASQILSPEYNARSYTDQTLRWFLSRDNNMEIESAKYLKNLDHYRTRQSNNNLSVNPIEPSKKKFSTETLVRYEKLPDRFVPVPIHIRSPSNPHLLQTTHQRSQSQPRPRHPSLPSLVRPSFQTSQQRIYPHSNYQSPLSRHQSVHELSGKSVLSQPPSPSPSLHSLHSHVQQRRPVAFHNRFATNKSQAPLFTEIIDSQTGRRFLTTSQEQLPTEVLNLLNKYNLQQV